jgi:hypothetical protein
MNPAFLRIPLYLIAHVDDLDAFTGLTRAQQQRLPEEYTPQEIHQMLEAMRIADADPEFDLVPFAPTPGFTNAQLHVFLKKVLKTIPV